AAAVRRVDARRRCLHGGEECHDYRGDDDGTDVAGSHRLADRHHPRNGASYAGGELAVQHGRPRGLAAFLLTTRWVLAYTIVSTCIFACGRRSSSSSSSRWPLDLRAPG